MRSYKRSQCVPILSSARPVPVQFYILGTIRHYVLTMWLDWDGHGSSARLSASMEALTETQSKVEQFMIGTKLS